jgi:hypothetical protein
MKQLLRFPTAWTIAIVFSGLSYFLPFIFFLKRSIVNLTISMNLTEALDSAAQLTEALEYGPQEYQSSAIFYTDNDAKTFVQRECGGVDTLTTTMEQDLYIP